MIVLHRDMKAASETCKVLSRTQTFKSLEELNKKLVVSYQSLQLTIHLMVHSSAYL